MCVKRLARTDTESCQRSEFLVAMGVGKAVDEMHEEI